MQISGILEQELIISFTSQISRLLQKDAEQESQMRAEIQTMKQELATISMMDEFARYARLERKINKMTDKLKTHGTELAVSFYKMWKLHPEVGSCWVVQRAETWGKTISLSFFTLKIRIFLNSPKKIGELNQDFYLFRGFSSCQAQVGVSEAEDSAVPAGDAD
uniref:Guided entry of tail-anchored proteins factor 1 n=1 Tax=Zonotrichia albicollis TaxID=44394 RepID=A0A8D2M4Z6_ZONAL